MLAIIYFIFFCLWIRKVAFFKDEHLSTKFIYVILIVKCLGCIAYYWVYFCYYPAGFNGDSASTLHDAKVMYEALPSKPFDYLKMVLGLHSDADTDPLYEPYFTRIEKWGRADITSDFFLNDNRTPIRINALIMMFSFGSYAVHALVMIILSFIGQFAIYKAFKKYVRNKESLWALIIFFTPSILFWTSGILKEPIAIFLLGLLIYVFFKIFIDHQFTSKHIFIGFFSVLSFFILKPYILILALIPLLALALVHFFKPKRLALFYLLFFVVTYGSGALILKFIFNKDVIHTIVVRQNDFINLSKGGIFFINGEHYVRLDHRAVNQYELVDSVKQLYRIKPHTTLMYWNVKNLNDTTFVYDNKDTSLFRLVSSCSPSGSAISMHRLEYSIQSFTQLLPISFYNVLFKPFFYDSHSILELMASFENLLFILFFILCFIFKSKEKPDQSILWFCVFLVLTSFILIGLTTTVMGAIVRYRIPFIPFLLMIPLLYLDESVYHRFRLFRKKC